MDAEKLLEENSRIFRNRSSDDTGQQNNGTAFTGIRPRNSQRSNTGRSSLSLNRHRNPQQSNSTRNDSNNASTSSRPDPHLPDIPNIRFSSLPQQERNSEPTQGFSRVTENRRGGGPSFSYYTNNTSDNASSSLNTGSTTGATASNSRDSNTRNRLQPEGTSSVRDSNTRNRLQPVGTSSVSGAGNPSTSRTSPKPKRNGMSPRRNSNRRSNTNNPNTNHNNTASNASSHRPGGVSNPNPLPLRAARVATEDSDEDLDGAIMQRHNTPPRAHNSFPAEDFVTPPRRRNTYGPFGSDVYGAGTEDEPFELLNDIDVAGPPAPADQTAQESLSRDEEFARQLQQEEWERASTPMNVGFRTPGGGSSRLQFLQALHGALGSGDPPTFSPNTPQLRQGRSRRAPAPTFGSRHIPHPLSPEQGLQLPDLFGIIPPGLMEMFVANGLISPEENDYETLLEMGEQIGAVSRGMKKRDIDKIPVRKHKSPANAASSSTQESSSEQCSICLSDFSVGEAKRILPCQHELHKDCIDPWLKTNATCPICRKDIREGK